MFSGRRQPSCDGTSRMTRECQVRFCERLGVKYPGPTRQSRRIRDVLDESGLLPTPDLLRHRSEPTLSAKSGHEGSS
jgi:hypothetical protein